MTKPTTADEYIEAELGLLSTIDKALFKLDSEQRLRVLKWVKSKYSKEWPSDAY